MVCLEDSRSPSNLEVPFKTSKAYGLVTEVIPDAVSGASWMRIVAAVDTVGSSADLPIVTFP